MGIEERVKEVKEVALRYGRELTNQQAMNIIIRHEELVREDIPYITIDEKERQMEKCWEQRKRMRR